MKYLNINQALAAWQNLQPLSEKDNEWYPLEKCDMSHKDACVTYWNGRRKQRKRRRTTEVDNAINSNLAPIFLQLPVENIVYTHQQDYYNRQMPRSPKQHFRSN